MIVHAKQKITAGFQISNHLRRVFTFSLGIGIMVFGIALSLDPERAWVAFLHNHFYFMCLGLGGLFFSAIQWVTGAVWSVPVRRVSEAFTAYLPCVAVTFVMICFGIPYLYLWSHPGHVQGNLVLEGKVAYLNIPFFSVRNLIAIILWVFFSKKMIGYSLAQDESKDPVLSRKNRVLSPVFLIVFAITFTMVSFDQLMSLDPTWFSTIFGVYCFSGLFYSNLAATCLLTLYLMKEGVLSHFVNENHLHDLGKFLFAFTIFWAYIAFSQFMLIWYANLPEETGYFIHRFNGYWFWVSIFLLVGKFLLPFFVLLPREAKRNQKILLFISVFMLVAQWIDVLWMVQPEFFKTGPRIGWIELGVLMGFIGLFGLVVSHFLARHNVIALGDPFLLESSVSHHQ